MQITCTKVLDCKWIVNL